MAEPNVPPAPDATIVIFGAMGDLTHRLLMPAMINMVRLNLVGDGFDVLGAGIDDVDDEGFRRSIDDFQSRNGKAEGERADAWAKLRDRVAYVQGDVTQDDLYAKIAERLGTDGARSAVFYLAMQPRFFGDVVAKLAQHGLLKEEGDTFRRVAIEKPFGHDLESARALNARLLECARESQLYRIDHFLGKETVQNIMATRFANTMIERLWTSDAIDSVQITAAETVDVGTRGKFYDATGALRDMVPNHLFSLLALVAMEPANSLDAEAVRDEKSKVLRAIRRYSPEDARKNGVRGAYTAGIVADKEVKAFTDTTDVAPDSHTETYVALKLMVDTWRWAGVPFYLRTGKAMAVRDTEVVIQFKPVPFAQFGDGPVDRLPPNRLVIQVQPDEGMHMDILIKRPGLVVDVAPVSLDFHYASKFDVAHLVGYEPLLYDLFRGEQTPFQRADGIEAAWAAVEPFLDAWAEGGAPEPYVAGTNGPDAADALIERDGRSWHGLLGGQG